MGKKNPLPFETDFAVASALDDQGQPMANELVEKLTRHYLDGPLPKWNKQVLALAILCDKDSTSKVTGKLGARWMTQVQFMNWAKKDKARVVNKLANESVKKFNKMTLDLWGSERHILFWILQKPNGDLSVSSRMIIRPLDRKG